MEISFDKVPELNLHLTRMTKTQAKDLIEYASSRHWGTKDFHQISQELEEFINSRAPSEPNNELLYLHAKLLFFAGDLRKLNDLFTLTTAIGDIPGIQIYYALGLAFQGHSKEGLEILKHIDSEFYENDPIVKLELLGVTLFIYSIMRNYMAVAEYYSQMYNFCETSNELSDEFKAHLLPWAYLRSAYSLRAEGRISRAMELITECQHGLRSFPHRFFQVMALTLMGHCYHNLGNIKMAFDFYDRAIDIGNETQSWLLLSILYNRVGMAMAAQKKPRLAKKYYLKAVSTAENANADWLQIGPLANLAQWKLAEGKIVEAIDDYHQFVEVATGAGDEKELCYAQLTLAELYRGIGDIAKCKYFLSEGFKLAIKLGIFRVISRPEDEADFN